MKFFVTGAFCIFSLLTTAQFDFSSHLSWTENTYPPLQTVVQDIDNDDEKDLVLISFDGVISVLRNEGETTFAQDEVLHDAGEGTYSFSLKDMNNDGQVDLLYSNDAALELRLCLNDGGVFLAPIVIYSGGLIMDLTVRDFDADGDFDIFYAEPTDGQFSWIENLTGDTYAAPKIVTTPDLILFCHFDGDGDGDLDLAAYQMVENRVIYYERSEGEYLAFSVLVDDWITRGEILALDRDGDDDLDLFFLNTDMDSITYITNLGGATFSSLEGLVTTDGDLIGGDAQDLDNDADQDLLLFYETENKWFENDGTGDFDTEHSLPHLKDTYKAYDFVDFEGDGDLDLFFGTDSNNDIFYAENGGDGTFLAPILRTNYAKFAGILESVDLDNDGDLDILAEASNKVFWYENNGDNSFQPQQLISNPADMTNWVMSVDFDNDGLLDIYVSTIHKLGWYKNLGGGNFTTLIVLNDAIYDYTTLETVDVDGDGNQDALYISAAYFELYWIKNLGSGVFEESPTTIGAVHPDNIEKMDVNEDGLDDIVVSALSGGLAWYENEGDGFASDILFINEDIASSLWNYQVTGDVNGDGKLDILLTVGEVDQVMWLENLGAGSFSEPFIICDSLEMPNSIIIADIDNNGTNDLITSFYGLGEKKIICFENEGGGVFTEGHILCDSMNNAYFSTVGDYNSTGEMDLVVAFTDQISLFADFISFDIASDVSIESAEVENLTLYPNPFSNNFQLIVDPNLKGQFIVSLYSLSAELIEEYRVSDSGQLTLGNTIAENGIYILVLTELNSGTVVYRQRIVKI